MPLKSTLVLAADKAWKAYLKTGGCDKPEANDAFDTAMLELRLESMKYTTLIERERAALVNIINAMNMHSEPIHYAIRAAILHGSEVLKESDLTDEGV